MAGMGLYGMRSSLQYDRVLHSGEPKETRL